MLKSWKNTTKQNKPKGCITCIVAIIVKKSLHCSREACSFAVTLESSLAKEFNSSTWTKWKPLFRHPMNVFVHCSILLLRWSNKFSFKEESQHYWYNHKIHVRNSYYPLSQIKLETFNHESLIRCFYNQHFSSLFTVLDNYWSLGHRIPPCNNKSHIATTFWHLVMKRGMS